MTVTGTRSQFRSKRWYFLYLNFTQQLLCASKLFRVSNSKMVLYFLPKRCLQLTSEILQKKMCTTKYKLKMWNCRRAIHTKECIWTLQNYVEKLYYFKNTLCILKNYFSLLLWLLVFIICHGNVVVIIEKTFMPLLWLT